MLFIPDNFCREDFRDQIRWTYHHQDGCQQGTDIQSDNQWPVEQNWYGSNVVCFRIKRDDAREILKGTDTQPDDVSPQHAFSYQK